MSVPLHVVFCAPYGLESTMRFVRAAASLDGVRLAVVTQEDGADFAAKLPEDARARIEAHARAEDLARPDQLESAVREIAARLGGRVDRLIGILEPLQESLAIVRERLGIRGMDAAEARRFRDKAHMKDTLCDAGLPCARHVLARSSEEALAFADEVLPLVAKPPAGAGGLDTFRVDDRERLASWLRSVPATPERPLLLEEFLSGSEHSFDAVTLGGRTVFASISDYAPTPLEVLETPWIQWTVLLPRSLDDERYTAIREAGPRALEALGMVNGLSHMEWFRRTDGSIAISEVAARPPGAQFTSLVSWAHDRDFYRVWAEVMVFERFDPPERRWAAGAAYLRGQGQGHVQRLEGVERLRNEIGDLVVEARLPKIGQAKASSYEGEGWVILRHAETEVVREALQRIVGTLRVELAS